MHKYELNVEAARQAHTKLVGSIDGVVNNTRNFTKAVEDGMGENTGPAITKCLGDFTHLMGEVGKMLQVGVVEFADKLIKTAEAAAASA
jgi:hypothetical protein